MNCTPVLGDFPERLERHAAARLELGAPGDVLDRLAQLARRSCCRAGSAARRPRAPRRPRRASRHSTSSGSPGRALARPSDGLPHPAGERGVVLLDQDRVVQPGAVVGAAAGGDRGLLQRPQPGRRLARVEDPRAGALDGSDAARASASRRPDSRCRKLSAVRSAVRIARAEPSIAQHRPALAPAALLGQALERDVRVELPERLLGDVEPEHDPGRLLGDQRARAGVLGRPSPSVVTSPSPTSSASARATISASARSLTAREHRAGPAGL